MIDSSSHTSTSAAPAIEVAGAGRVLILDDEARILSALRRLLRPHFECDTTTDPKEALDWLIERDYSVVVSDQRMPELLGSEFLGRARRVSPDTERILLTGYSDAADMVSAINEGGISRFVAKPWDDDNLVSVLNEADRLFRLTKEHRALTELSQKQTQKLRAFNATLRQCVLERTKRIGTLNDQLAGALRGTLSLLANLSDLHSPALGRHANRVAELATRIAGQIGMEQEEIYQIEAAALLHDLGKMGAAPRAIPTRDDHEFDHAVIGARLLESVPDLRHATTYVLHHHERFDGTGTPGALAGTRIPLGARILAVANAYDHALNQVDRFAAATTDLALAKVREASGTALDPDLVASLAVIVRSGSTGIEADELVEVRLRDLRPGMVLARDLVSIAGSVLVSQGTQLTTELIEGLSAADSSARVGESIYIKRRMSIRLSA